ncbi:hypothetical protein Y032_0100g3323 [Ancylostoma ceylanicum]|uniref:OB domain-containing protein n=1 Tax=Ancylostoma ceylanicum TaxID=53326 RepID=A0A016TIQ5_9BILA|nr:hypothetical protein Y032_0100g3323 [Ancylostoma ceylanicum]
MTVPSRSVVWAFLRSTRCFSNESVKIPSDIGPSSIRLNGWVQKVQKCGTNVFLHISDGLSPEPVQVVMQKELCRLGTSFNYYCYYLFSFSAISSGTIVLQRIGGIMVSMGPQK